MTALFTICQPVWRVAPECVPSEWDLYSMLPLLYPPMASQQLTIRRYKEEMRRSGWMHTGTCCPDLLWMMMHPITEYVG